MDLEVLSFSKGWVHVFGAMAQTLYQSTFMCTDKEEFKLRVMKMNCVLLAQNN